MGKKVMLYANGIVTVTKNYQITAQIYYTLTDIVIFKIFQQSIGDIALCNANRIVEYNQALFPLCQKQRVKNSHKSTTP